MPTRKRTRSAKGGRCDLCGQKLLMGVQHVCPAQAKASFDWKWALAFALQFLVLFSTIMWKGGAIQQDVTNLQRQVDHLQTLSDRYYGGNLK